METLHTRYYKLRKKILGIFFLALLVLIIVVKFLLPDYLVKENELQVESGVIQTAFMNKYPEHSRASLSTVYKSCLDVILQNKPYYIRFTDQLDTKYWAAVKDSKNTSKSIEVKFEARQLQNGILYNPDEVIIDNKVVIPADSKKWFLGLSIIGFSIFIIVCIYFLSKFWKLYKEGLYWQDKQIAAESKWELISMWIND